MLSWDWRRTGEIAIVMRRHLHSLQDASDIMRNMWKEEFQEEAADMPDMAGWSLTEHISVIRKHRQI